MGRAEEVGDERRTQRGAGREEAWCSSKNPLGIGVHTNPLSVVLAHYEVPCEDLSIRPLILHRLTARRHVSELFARLRGSVSAAHCRWASRSLATLLAICALDRREEDGLG